MQILSYIDSIRETRTGVRRFSAGIAGDELNPYASTATGINKVDDASQDTILLIARNFAEQGLKQLFKRVFELTMKHQDKAQQLKLRGQWVPIDPTTWDTEFDMTVTVGLGSGDQTKMAQAIGSLMPINQQIVMAQGGSLNGPILTAENLYNQLNKLIQFSGFKIGDALYTDPKTMPPQQPQPNPEMQKAQMEQQSQQAMHQMSVQADQAKTQTRVQADAQLQMIKAKLQQQEAEMQAQLKAWELMQERQSKQHDAVLNVLTTGQQMRHDEQAHQQDMALNAHKAALAQQAANAAQQNQAAANQTAQ